MLNSTLGPCYDGVSVTNFDNIIVPSPKNMIDEAS